MAYPPLNYKSGELSQGEIDLNRLATNPMTDGSALQLLGGATSLRRGAAQDAQDAYRQDLALAMANQAETRRAAMAGELTTGLNSANPEALSIMSRLPATAGIFTGAGGVVDPDVAARMNLSRTNLARNQQANIQDKYLSGYKSGVEAGIVPPPDVQAAQLGFTPTQQLPLTTANTYLRETMENARHSADATKAQTGSLTYASGDGVTAPRFSITGMNPTIALQSAAYVDQLNQALKQPHAADVAGQPVINMPQQMIPAPYVTTDKSKNVTGVGMTGGGSFPAGGVSPPSAGGATPATTAAGATLTPARPAARGTAQPNSSAPASDKVAPPIVLGGGQTQAAPQSGARMINGIPTMAPDNIQVTPMKLSSPEATKALQAMAAQFYARIAGNNAYPPEVKDRVRQFVGAGAIGIGVDANGRKWFTMNGQPVAAASQ